MGLNVKRAIYARGFTIKAMAAKIGISPVMMSNQINGNPTLATLQRIANTMECDISELFEPLVENHDNSITCPKCGSKFVLKE
jgi:transcriptional regulator with XRE-family HTH domain